MVLRLEDGRSFTIACGKAPRAADLEPPGLYYSYATHDSQGRVTFMRRPEVLRRLGGLSRSWTPCCATVKVTGAASRQVFATDVACSGYTYDRKTA
jgi:hypothetical protein